VDLPPLYLTKQVPLILWSRGHHQPIRVD